MEQGCLFTVATARSIATVAPMVEGLALRVPLILLNGACSYDVQHRWYTSCCPISQEALCTAIGVLQDQEIQGFLFALESEILVVRYEELKSRASHLFYQERQNLTKYKRFVQTRDLLSDAQRYPAIYFSMCDDYEILKPAYDALSQIEGISCVFYRDVYYGYYYLEFFSSDAGKANAVQTLRKQCGANEVIVFGDNTNDFSMFGIADRKYAVANAIDGLKAIADGVIGSNEEDGVATFIQGDMADF